MSIRRLLATASSGMAIALVVGTSPLQAQGTPADLNKDSKLIREVASDNLFEIRLGTIAKSKATNANVKQFGERMVTDHTWMLENWRALVKQSGFPFQPGLQDKHEDEVKRLEKLSGAEFDRAYMTAMIQDHQNAVAKFESARNTANSEPVRTRLSSDLPALRQHVNLAMEVGGQVGATTNVAVNPPVTTPTPPVAAPSPTPNAPVATPNVQTNQEDLSADRKFIVEAIADNVLEIRLAKLAEKNSSDTQVKQYAQQVLSDHTTMQNQWLALASRNGMNLKPGMGPRHKKKATRLEKLDGREFDRAYMTTQVQNQQDYVEYFGKEGRATRSSQVRDLAANDLRSLELHLNQAKQVGAEVGVNVSAALRARQTAAYRNQ
jgi:putative membrane protein